MNTEDFLRLVWPEGDHYFVVEAVNDKMNHHHIQSVGEAAKRIKWRDDEAEGNVYLALASFKQDEYIDSKGKRRRRTQENAARLKCFWIDMDCKGRPTDYANQKDAVKDILRLCSETKLQLPTTVVNSGYGIHAYWVLDESISADDWMTTAKRWRATLDACKIRHDPACTTDSARILRPVGTHNRKMGEAARDVTLVGPVRSTLTLTEFRSKLSGNDGPRVFSSGLGSVDLSLNELAIDAVEYRPSSIKEIVKECSLVKAVAKLGGNVSEPVWHKTLGLVKHTIEGAQAIHFFSKGHPDYSPADTEAKAAAWEAGPTTCEIFSRESSQELPGHCNACRHAGQIKSPIQLGYAKVMMTEQAVVHEATGFVEKVVEVASLPVSMEGRFKWENGKLWKNELDKGASKQSGQNVFQWIPFCEFLFYPSSYYRDVSDKHRMVWTLREREGVYKEFEVSGGSLGAGGQALFKELGDCGVTSMTGGKNHMEAYLTHWGNELKKSAAGSETFMHYGWHGDTFVHGDTMYKPDGTSPAVRVGGDAVGMLKHINAKGSLDTWKQLIDKAYNHKGQETYQFIFGLGFGSILMPFMNVAGGVVVSAVSYGTGQGKTTTMRNAFGIYGCPAEGTSVTLARSSVTHKGIFGTAGVLHNYPLMVDEMTNIEGKELSDIVYTWSQGQPRIRLVGTGGLAPVGFGWSGVLLTSSNKPMTSIIAGAKPGADAELARLIEFDCTGIKKLKKEEADPLFKSLNENYGVAGPVFIQWVVTHQDEVRQLLSSVQVTLDKRMGFTGENRFWSAGYAVGITGLMIARKLGLVGFDLKAVTEWCVAQLREMRGEIVNSVLSPDQCFGKMLTDLSPGIIVTDIEGGRGTGGKEAYVIKEPRGPYTGRAITSTGLGYLSQPAVHKWCVENQVDMKAVMKSAFESGWALSESAEKRYPGKGTNFAMGQTRCFTLDWARLENSVQTAPHIAEVVSMMNRGKVS